MGLTKNSVGIFASADGDGIEKKSENERVVAFAGKANVGKSTIFNSLTGMNQHTGNWSGKTVSSAIGRFETEKYSYIAVDLPGTYSLFANSKEEELSRDFILSEKADAVVVVADATSLEASLTLVLQVLEITSNVIVCVNLIDEAEKSGISIDLSKLEKLLGVTVIGTVGRKKKSARALSFALDRFFDGEVKNCVQRTDYSIELEAAAAIIEDSLTECEPVCSNTRFFAMRLLDGDADMKQKLLADIQNQEAVISALKSAEKELEKFGISKDEVAACTSRAVSQRAEKIASAVRDCKNNTDKSLMCRIDRIVTDKYMAFPIMALFFAFIFWLTVRGANYPSRLLSELLFGLEDSLCSLADFIKMPEFLHGLLIHGAYRVLAWVVSVMLPPMAIFFPLFTLLEDSGFLPRIAYNLDRPFSSCSACGKQSLTMCMGFGCNAAGVVGCRIIESPRERLLAILTNNFVPCNGRFPTLIVLVGIIGVYLGVGESGIFSAVALCAIIVFSVLITLASTKLLSKTILKGEPSSFALELPPYRRPQIGKVIVRSIFDRTLHVLARSAAVAAPAGALIWFLANTDVSGVSLLTYAANFLDPIGTFIGLDGVILLGFILGLPANEIVLPIILMTYSAAGSLTEITNPAELQELLTANGFTLEKAIAVIIFTLMHFPCSTTLLTVKKETGSIKWTVIAAVYPTLLGVLMLLFLKLIM